MAARVDPAEQHRGQRRPLLSPGYQASTTAATWLIHGITTGAPASITTTVRGLAAATAEISSFCADGRFRLARSAASDSVSSDTTTTAVSPPWPPPPPG